MRGGGRNPWCELSGVLIFPYRSDGAIREEEYSEKFFGQLASPLHLLDSEYKCRLTLVCNIRGA